MFNIYFILNSSWNHEKCDQTIAVTDICRLNHNTVISFIFNFLIFFYNSIVFTYSPTRIQHHVFTMLFNIHIFRQISCLLICSNCVIYYMQLSPCRSGAKELPPIFHYVALIVLSFCNFSSFKSGTLKHNKLFFQSRILPAFFAKLPNMVYSLDTHTVTTR